VFNNLNEVFNKGLVKEFIKDSWGISTISFFFSLPERSLFGGKTN
jgi:hypothetical protein